MAPALEEVEEEEVTSAAPAQEEASEGLGAAQDWTESQKEDMILNLIDGPGAEAMSDERHHEMLQSMFG